jgi:KaiC/GvpD/RAD55 family RecA-like ATPase
MYDLGERLDGRTVAPGTNILVLGPPLTGKRRLARQILHRGLDDDEGAIVITTRDSAQRVSEQFAVDEYDGEHPIGIVDCVTEHVGRSTTDTLTVKYATSPVDMTGIGLGFSNFIEYFYGELGRERNRVMVDSLSTLLMYATLQTVFEFMHAITSRVDDVDAIGVHVIESTAHDDQTLHTMAQLFDGTIELDEDGIVAVDLPSSAETADSA